MTEDYEKFLEWAEDEFLGQDEGWEQWMYIWLFDWASKGAFGP